MKKTKNYFKCEICGCEVPNECEGAEPNTCAECVPLDTEKIGQIKRNRCDMGKFPREAETPPKTAQNEPNLNIVGLQEKIIELVVDIEKFISRNAEIEIAPHGDFKVIISLAKLSDFFEKIKEGENNGQNNG